MNKLQTHITPSKWSLRLLKLMVRAEYLEEIGGDMQEVFEDELDQFSAWKCQWRFLWQVVKLARPSLIKKTTNMQLLNLSLFWKQNIVGSFRNFKRHKTSFALNMAGLSTGILAVLAIFLWVEDEWGMDRIHEDGDRLYKVIQNSIYPDGIETYDGSPALLAKAVMEELPEVETAVTINNEGENSGGILSAEGEKALAKGLYASDGFFQIFSFPLIDGNRQALLKGKTDIVLSENLAYRLFGTTQGLVGKTVKGNRALNREDYVVTGIFKDISKRSTLQFDFIINYETTFKHKEWLNEWTADGSKTFIKLRENTDAATFNERFKTFLKDKPERETDELFIQQFADSYLFGQYENGKVAGGRILYVRLLTMGGVLIILLACINFMNLATAQALRRMKAVGVKKLLGAKRTSLISQFTTESILLVGMAAILATLLLSSLLPSLSQLTGKSLVFSPILQFLPWLLGFVLLLGVLAGIYPAFYISAFQPLAVLKRQADKHGGGGLVRKGLSITQFVVAIVFISSFITINRQLRFIHETPLGYDREQVVYFKLRKTQDRQPFLNELRTIPGVLSVGNSWGGSIVGLQGAGMGFSWGEPETQENISFRRPHIGYNYVETLNVSLLEGRTFSSEFGDEENKLIVNKAAAEIIGREGIVGKMIMDGDFKKEIIGVVDNFKILSLYEPIQPTIMRFASNGSDIIVRMAPGREKETLEKIEAVHQQFDNEYPFNATFLDQQYERMYATEKQIAGLSSWFMVIAMVISCLGLLGLTTFSVERRVKEIGIRKVLGAGSLSIIRLINKEFTTIIIIALLIGLPLGHYLSTNWLNDFAYHVSPGLGFLLLTAFSALILALSTISLTAMKAANSNPVNSLRNE